MHCLNKAFSFVGAGANTLLFAGNTALAGIESSIRGWGEITNLGLETVGWAIGTSSSEVGRNIDNGFNALAGSYPLLAVPSRIGQAGFRGLRGAREFSFLKYTDDLASNNSSKMLEGVTKNTMALPAPTHIPNAGGKIVSDVTKQDEIFYRVFSGDSTVGAFLTKVPPKSKAFAQDALALPPQNQADFLQQVLVPAGTRLQRSRAMPVPQWERYRGGAEQFELLERIPVKNFGEGVPLK